MLFRRADVRYEKPMRIPGTVMANTEKREGTASVPVMVGLRSKFTSVIAFPSRLIRSAKRVKVRLSKTGILW